jgi:hypothetical protein
LQAGNRWLEPGFHGNGKLLVIYPVWEPGKNRFCLRA